MVVPDELVVSRRQQLLAYRANHSSGFTLVELLTVILIIGAVITGALFLPLATVGVRR